MLLSMKNSPKRNLHQRIIPTSTWIFSRPVIPAEPMWKCDTCGTQNWQSKKYCNCRARRPDQPQHTRIFSQAISVIKNQDPRPARQKEALPKPDPEPQQPEIPTLVAPTDEPQQQGSGLPAQSGVDEKIIENPEEVKAPDPHKAGELSCSGSGYE